MQMTVCLRDGVFTLTESEPSAAPLEMLFAGDVCPRGATESLILAGQSRDILADVAEPLAKKHLSVVNVEAPLTRAETPIPKSGPNLKVHPDCVDLLAAGGWDVACCANNHIGDFGPGAVQETLDLLADRGLNPVGAGPDLESARKPLLLTKNGITVAFLAMAENEFGMAGSGKAGANPLAPVRTIARIRAAREMADLVIVLIHGGNEFLPVPSPRMVDTYRAFADAGASAVVAGHTHGPQGMEIWNGTPIVYSLGNFLFGSRPGRVYKGYNWWYGYMVRIRFSAGAAVRLEVIPHHDKPDATALSLLRGEERALFLDYLNYLNGLFTGAEDEAEITRYFDAWCMKTTNGYFSTLGTPFTPVDWEDPASVHKLMAMRNLHTCEAHNELITATLRILEERREQEAKLYLKPLADLCEGRIPG